MKIAGLVPHSFVDGPGIRFSIFFQGCNHNCKGCHNPETHDIHKGSEISTENIISEFKSTKFIEGITLSGGDPFMQPLAVYELSKAAQENGLSVWCYTGYLFENILNKSLGNDAYESLKYINVLVDGPFIEELKPKDLSKCLFRGSTNQRLIDVQKSLQENKIITL